MCGVLWVQTVRHEVRRVRTGDPAHAGRPQGPGQRLPPAVLLLRDVRQAAQHRRRVLPHGGPEAGLQAGLRGCEDERYRPRVFFVAFSEVLITSSCSR